MRAKQLLIGLGISICFLFVLSIKPGYAVPMTDLFAGGSYQLGDLQLSNWDLVSSTNVNVSNLNIENSDTDQLLLQTLNHELYAGYYQSKSITFDFLVTGLGVNIDQMAGDLGARRIRGYWWDSPWIGGNITLGSSKGSSDLGSNWDWYAFNADPDRVWLDLPDGINELWVRSTVSLYGADGYAEAGYWTEPGPAFLVSFLTTPAEPPAVPEPATALLLGVGLAGLAAMRFQRKKTN